MQTIEIPVELLDAATFAPYGVLLERNRRSADFENAFNRMIDLGFQVDGTPSLNLIRYPKQEMVTSRLERHLTMTEARVSLSESVVLLVAAPTSITDRRAFPDPASVRAFLLEGGNGLMFARGVWHGLDCYPATASHADFAFFTEREAEAELALDDPDQYDRTHIIDFAPSRQLSFKVTDPKGLLRRRSER